MTYSPTPAWELMKANFDIEYTEMKNEENPHILSYKNTIVKSHLAGSYARVIFTAELVELLMALSFIVNLPMALFSFCFGWTRRQCYSH